MNVITKNELDRLAEYEERDPIKALSWCRHLSRQNTKVLWWMLLIASMFAIAGFYAAKELETALRLSKFLRVAVFGLIGFFPPFFLHVKQMFKLQEPRKRSRNPWPSALLMFGIVFLSPVAAAFAAFIGLLVFAFPFLLLIRGLSGRALLDATPLWPDLFFVLPALAISFAYLLSPNKLWSSPFPLRILFSDAFVALYFGFKKVMAVVAGTIMMWTFDALYREGFGPRGLIFCGIGGILIGFLLLRLECDTNLGRQLMVARARLLKKLGRIYAARYWAAEAHDRMDDSTPEEIAKEIVELAESLKLKM